MLKKCSVGALKKTTIGTIVGFVDSGKEIEDGSVGEIEEEGILWTNSIKKGIRGISRRC